ncbi:MAG: methylthioribulose 1-phosphate dehydratase [Blastocatellia bacterium]|nr:methylthioribulose 1-phosphate dehydratase [Blastocatellia bacterium]
MAKDSSLPAPALELVEAGKQFYQRGWTLGTSGNFSVLLARRPMRLWITAAGNEKGDLDDTNFLEIDDDAEILHGFGKPSDETLLHLTVYRLRPKARCILFSHSVAGTILSDRSFTDGALRVKGYEVLKGLAGVTTHEHTETIPIVENSQDFLALSHVVENVLLENKDIHAIFLRRNGLYTWGETVDEARRNVEIFEFLFNVVERTG